MDVQGPDAVLTGPVGGGATLDLTSGQVLVSAPRYGAEVVLGGPQGPQGEVGFLPALTGAPGTDVVLEDLDPSPHRALIQLTIPEGQPGAPGAPIGGILTTRGDLVARDATTAVRVPVGAPNEVLTADPAAAAGVKWAAPAAAASGWPQVALWADLPTYTTVPLGTRYHVTSGLGVLYALRGPTGWVVDENSDTGWWPLTLSNGWTQLGATYRTSIRRSGYDCRLSLAVVKPATFNANIVASLPDGFGSTGPMLIGGGHLVSSNMTSANVPLVVFPHSTTTAVIWGAVDNAAFSQWYGHAAWSLNPAEPWPTTPPA